MVAAAQHAGGLALSHEREAAAHARSVSDLLPFAVMVPSDTLARLLSDAVFHPGTQPAVLQLLGGPLRPLANSTNAGGALPSQLLRLLLQSRDEVQGASAHKALFSLLQGLAGVVGDGAAGGTAAGISGTLPVLPPAQMAAWVLAPALEGMAEETQVGV